MTTVLLYLIIGFTIGLGTGYAVAVDTTGPIRRWYLQRVARQRVVALADGFDVDQPTPRGKCHICHIGVPLIPDPYNGTNCCTHCGAPADLVPGGMPLAGVAASPEHRDGSCECRSVGRPDLDTREYERHSA